MTQHTPPAGKASDGGESELHTDIDNNDIPLLSEPVADTGDKTVEQEPDESADDVYTLSLQQAVLEDDQHEQIATLEAIVFDGDKAKTPMATAKPPAAAAPSPEAEPPLKLTPVAAPRAGKPLPQKSDNPFLPQHILDRLNQGRRNLVEEIAQSGAALDASTAMLRTRSRAERLQHASEKPAPSDAQDKTARQKQQLIDDLVDEYLPLLASELRRRLKKLIDE